MVCLRFPSVHSVDGHASGRVHLGLGLSFYQILFWLGGYSRQHSDKLVTRKQIDSLSSPKDIDLAIRHNRSLLPNLPPHCRDTGSQRGKSYE